MIFNSLEEFVLELEKRGELKRIKEPVDAELEISEITDRVSKMSAEKNVALLFENVKGYNMPVLINAFGSLDKISLALGVEKIDDIAKEIEDILQLPYISIQNKLDLLKLIPMVKRSINFPKYVKKAPCKEVIIKDNPSIEHLPILKCWPQDAGKFITFPLTFTKNPLNGKRNIGMYRMQVYDKNTLGMHWHIHKNGAENYRAHLELGKDKMEAAVVIGSEPLITYAATAPLPKDIDEMIFAGFLRKKAVDLIKCETVDIEVPASAEIVLEGYIDIKEKRTEGPFGDHTGFYSLADEYPVFHLTCITQRKNPIYFTTIVGKPPMEDCYLAKATERVFLPLIKQQIPEIVDINLPFAGVFHNCAIVSIKKTYPKQAQKVMHAIWGLGQMMFTKMIVVVDEHINVHDLNEVFWYVSNNIDAKRDFTMVEGPLDALDHSSPIPNFGTKLGVDATKKLPNEGHTREWPDEIIMSKDIKNLVDLKWNSLGLD